MKVVFALLLSSLGLIAIIFSRFAVEETRRIIPAQFWTRLPFWLARLVVTLSGLFFILFGVLTMLGYWR